MDYTIKKNKVNEIEVELVHNGVKHTLKAEPQSDGSITIDVPKNINVNIIMERHDIDVELIGFGKEKQYEVERLNKLKGKLLIDGEHKTCDEDLCVF